MNPLRPPTSSSKQHRTRQIRGAPAALAGRSPTVDGAPAAPGDGSSFPPVFLSPRLQQHLQHFQVFKLLVFLNGGIVPLQWAPVKAKTEKYSKARLPLFPQPRVYPPGGFTNFLQSKSAPKNSHLVGNTTSKPPISPSIPSVLGSLPGENNTRGKESINVDDDETVENERTEKRLNWTKDEDIRLASAWLRNSKDLVDGTDRRSDQFWTDVTKEYNESTEQCRKRNRNQLKICWDRVKKKPVSEFHGCWVKTTCVYRSDYSDDQLMDIADKMYASEHNDKDFMLKHIWKVVRNERKWSAYVKKLLEPEKQTNNGGTTKRVEVINLEDNPNTRPIGHKKAKDERYGNKKTPAALSAVSEKLDKFIEVTTMAIGRTVTRRWRSSRIWQIVRLKLLG